MTTTKLKLDRRQRRRKRVRGKMIGRSDRPRLSLFRSNKHIYAQIIDDASGRTICAANTKLKLLSGQVKNGGNCQSAAMVGQVLAEQARMQNIRQVAFDRGCYRYHGRVKALAEAARKGGLAF